MVKFISLQNNNGNLYVWFNKEIQAEIYDSILGTISLLCNFIYAITKQRRCKE